jgi:hypothetical protein
MSTTVALLDRADRRIRRPDHAEAPAQLDDHGQARVRVSAGSGAPIRGCCRDLPAPLRILFTK